MLASLGPKLWPVVTAIMLAGLEEPFSSDRDAMVPISIRLFDFLATLVMKAPAIFEEEGEATGISLETLIQKKSHLSEAKSEQVPGVQVFVIFRTSTSESGLQMRPPREPSFAATR